MKRLLQSVLVIWTLAVFLPMAWIGVNALRSSREFVENPFGVPWLFTGAPPDGTLSRDEVDGPEAGSWLSEHFTAIDQDGNQQITVAELENLPPDLPAAPERLEALTRIAALDRGHTRSAVWAQVKTNFYNAWVKSQFSRFFLNSLWVVGISLTGILILGSMTSYVLARFAFPGQGAIYAYILAGMMIPAQLILVPLFFQFSSISKNVSAVLEPFGLAFQLHDSHTGIILLYVALSLPFTVMVLTSFFKSLPGELREAGIIDGCNETQVFWHVMLPLARPGIITAAIFNFIGLWNEYLFALVFLYSPEKKTLPLGLASVSMQAQYKTDFGLTFAGLVIVIVPTIVVYAILQRRIAEGITMGALKG